MKIWNYFFSARKLAFFRVLVALTVLTNLFAAPFQAPVRATGTNCVTSSPNPLVVYTITVCIDAPTDGATITGTQTISASTPNPTGANPGVAKLIFSMGLINQPADYLLTDYQPPYSFTLPSTKFVDGAYTLQVVALMKDSKTSDPASITITLNNGITTLPPANNSFAPTAGSTPSAGQSFTLVATGDGADGATNAGNVTTLINSWNPNLFLYLGDVYEKGTATEFYNWYGQASTFYGQFRAITDPAIGNHEYEHGVAPGYRDYWNLGTNTPTYYSYDAGGWHFIALNSNCGLLHDCAVGQTQYNWLLNDLNTHNNVCTIAYFHHPVFNIGYEDYATSMNDMWALMASKGVDIVLTGHDHDYQRWMPLDGNVNNSAVNGIGNPSPTGITQFVAGGGGHGIQTFKTTDNRMVIGFDTSPNTFGALRMQLNQYGASFQYINYQGTTLDSGAIPCNGAPTDTTAPTTPTNLTATTHSATQADLSWGGSTDNVGVAGYDIYRNGSLLTSVGFVTSYSDTNLTMGANYDYQVKARDAAGNTSGFSNAATAAMPSVLFSDGFESGDFSAWTLPVTNIQITSQEHYAGTFAARATSTGTAGSYASKTLSTTYNDLYYSLRFKIISKSSTTSAYVQRFRTASDGGIGGVLVSGNNGANRLGYRSEIMGGATNTTGPVVTFGVWHEVQTHLHIDSTNSANDHIDIWYDGTLVNELSTNANFGVNPIGRINVGDRQAGDIYDVVLDEVAVNTSKIDTNDGQAPSVPTGLTATATAPNSVNLAWNAATDNISVTGYDLYRNGSLAATLGTVTSYTDSPVTPAFTYQYQIRARDAAGNVSALSAASQAATVTTPADTTGPTVTLTEPADGASVSANVTLAADATDNVAVEDVDFLVNGTIVGTVGEGGPYNMFWDSTTVPDGPVTITAHAVDTSGNATDASVTVNVNNAGGDTTPPTVPGNFAATAAGASQVNLSWSASSDNVAVTGYDVYRDGTLWAQNVAATSYSDTNVVIGTTYQYQVLARDAAGNVSALTTAKTVTIPALLFSHGFESGNLVGWTNQGNGLFAQQQTVLEGAFAAEANSSGPASWAYTQLSQSRSNLYARVWFKIISKGANNVNLLRFRTSATGSGAAILGVFVSTTGKLGITNDFGGASPPTSTTQVGNGAWHLLQAHVNIGTGQVEIWLDGAPVSDLSQTLSLGTAPIGQIQIGESIANRVYDVAFDEVAADTSLIQSGGLYTTIDGGPMGPVASNAANFSFSATEPGTVLTNATFECSLDGAAFSACTSPQLYSSLADGAHTFAVRATDASANVDPTPAGRTWTVDTTAPTVTNTAPADVATDVPITTAVDATFSETISASTLTASNFTLVKQSDGSPIATTISYDVVTNTVTLHPTSILEYSTTYVATVKGGAGGVADLAGNPLASDKVWSFTTFGPDTTPPGVTLTAPPDGTTVSGSVILSADATDNIGIDHVDFQVDGTLVGTDSSAPFSITWDSTSIGNGPVTITAKAVDTSANATTSAGNNVTIANDVTPPAAPTNLTANTVSSGQVDLSWTAATDDTGVTGNDIYRDGTLLASVGPVTSYSDTTTDPSTTYQYQVRARDAAGHVSDFSTSATANTPAALFSDGFETGDLSRWSVVTGLAMQQQPVHTGAYAVLANSSGSATYANKAFGAAQYELYYTTWFNISSLDPNNSVYLQRFIKADASSTLGVFISKTGKLGYRNDISTVSNTSGPSVSLNVWHKVKTHIRIDLAGGAGQVEIWFDGVPVAALSQAETFGNAPIARVQLGDNATGHTYNVAFDDVTVTTPADSTPPTVTLTAPANGARVGGTVTLSATANDNVGVDHVDFLVNGTVVGTASTAPYSINWNSTTTADGGATITARAVDLANNTTTSSGASVTVDNTPPDTTITAGPNALTNSTSASLSFTATEAGATFACSLDNAAFSACTSPTTYTGLVNGLHTFQVRSTDAAGNTDASAASTTWTVDTLPPTVTSTVPVGGATGISPAANITAVFSEAMNATTITSSTFTIKIKQGNNPPLAAVVTYDPVTRTATLDPNANLSNNTAYTVTVKSGVSGVKDVAGNALASDFSWNFTTGTLDVIPPSVTLTAPLNGATVSGTVTLSATASDNVAVNHVDFLVNNVVVGTDSTSPYSLSWNSASVADGSATITARAMDNASNANTSTATVTVNNTTVDTTITGGPSGSVNTTSASFSFTATIPGSTFACSLDGATFSTCTSPIAYSGLANGSHMFQVRATSPSGSTDPSPASRTWTVDTVLPDTTITAGPSGTVTSTSASFSFTATETASFTCSLDGAAFSACSSPQNYTNLTNGSHTFQVRATDAAGNVDATPASRTWTIDILAPDTTISGGPSGSVNNASPSFSFTATEAGSTFACSLDGTAFSACSSPQNYINLTNGSHTFQVRATDAVGNTDSTPASRTWTVDTIGPTGVAITSPASGASVTGQVTISASASDNLGVAQVEFYVDGQLLTNDTSAPYSITWNTKKATLGNHTLFARAYDAAGNMTQSSNVSVTVR